ncbi:hypothetical protein [Macrococcus capreoli]|uniref:hypothetical protein n=1 Tax=Macrococcus capreoli TaxID=2982690 RepID=UPI003EE605C2
MMSLYAKTIINQFEQYSKCEFNKTENKSGIIVECYFPNGRKKIFRSDTWDGIAFEMNGFMRRPFFKVNYILPVLQNERWDVKKLN